MSAVQRKPGAANAGALAAQTEGDHAAPLIRLLISSPSAVREDPVVAYLNTLDTHDQISAIDGAAEGGYSPQLRARLTSGRPFLIAALYAVELARAGSVAPNHPLLQRAGVAIDGVSRDQQLQILEYLLYRGGVSVEATMLMEGVVAMRSGADLDTAAASHEQLPTGAGRGAADEAGAPASDEHAIGASIGAVAAGGGAPAPINPGPWAQPGDQPGGLYVGISAHDAIGESYRAAHVGDRMFFNHTPLSSILGVFESLAKRNLNPSALAKDELLRRPDIVNLKRKHLYEIKPAAAQAAASTKAKMYLSLFERAGADISLGPMGEPGTSGGLPAPAGVFMFQSPEPGVITYEYRKGRLVPVPVAQPEPATARNWRWEVQPLTRIQKQAIVTTTVGGAMLLLIMIILSPLGA
ncbi:MAG TPA: hypothetical protein VH165_20715 [Kofleriaceae bacterium]|jgi:hypothetical protein|nr:hypothetical protein [Kofleriaceae bacterium]